MLINFNYILLYSLYLLWICKGKISNSMAGSTCLSMENRCEQLMCYMITDMVKTNRSAVPIVMPIIFLNKLMTLYCICLKTCLFRWRLNIWLLGSDTVATLIMVVKAFWRNCLSLTDKHVVWGDYNPYLKIQFNPSWLTHWGRDELAAIYKTTFSNAFCWMKMHEFRLRFHWNLFPRVH